MSIKQNLVPFSAILILICSKMFAWWLLFFGTNIMHDDMALQSIIKPLHQFSYITLTTFLAFGLFSRSPFPVIAFYVAFCINAILFYLIGNKVYQWLWDIFWVTVFVVSVNLCKPNRWLIKE